jgi:hypothetical protein
MLSQGSIHFRQELINLISYVKRGGYRDMSECSIYQLLLQTDYVRRREKYDHLYIYSHILSYIRAVETRQVSVNHCFAGTNCLTTAVKALDGTRILTFNSRNPSRFCQPLFRRHQLPYNSRQNTRRGDHAMSECSKYQLLLQTDYVRLREKYDYLYIYSHNAILHCP